ncbi:MAG: hypothetical protein IH991_05635 [Planctomycetes bacterium]|nr:hypothetical protein [Planctomycetota bacterium]
MSETETKKRRKRKLQFSLLWVMVLTFLAAFAVNCYRLFWYEPPGMVERQLGDGMIIKVQTRNVVDETGVRASEYEYHGKCFVFDKYGRKLCEGEYAADLPSGKWTFYHNNGRKASRGEYREGHRVGEWESWYEDGNVLSQIEYSELAKHFVPLGRLRRTTGLGIAYLDPFDSNGFIRSPRFEMASHRQGLARQWWSNGEMKSEGNFRKDLREGKWTFWNEQGTVTANGTYRNGQPFGEWQERGDDSKLVEVYYLRGQRIQNFQAVQKRLIAKLKSNDRGEMLDAIQQLAAFGAAAVEPLANALDGNDKAVCIAALKQLARMGNQASGASDKIKRLGFVGKPQLHDSASREFSTRRVEQQSRERPVGKSLDPPVDLTIRGEAVLTLYAIDDITCDDALGRLFALALKTSGQSRTLLLKQIAKLGEPAIPSLQRKLASDSEADRIAALAVMNKMLLAQYFYTEEQQTVKLLNAVYKTLVDAKKSHPSVQVRKLAELILEHAQLFATPFTSHERPFGT